MYLDFSFPLIEVLCDAISFFLTTFLYDGRSRFFVGIISWMSVFPCLLIFLAARLAAFILRKKHRLVNLSRPNSLASEARALTRETDNAD